MGVQDLIESESDSDGGPGPGQYAQRSTFGAERKPERLQ